MKIYPAIDILNGRAVRLRQGRKEDVTVYGHPLEMAQRWFEKGAEWLHVVDLDGAFDGTPRNQRAIAEIIAAFPRLKVQLGGGIRNLATLESILGMGVQRAVLGTSLITDETFATEALRKWNDRVAVGIDAQDGIAKVAGWTEDSRIAAMDLARRLQDKGARIVIYTDIARDGVLVGPNIPALQQMLDGTQLNVIASGGVSKLEDIRALAAFHHPRLDGVIVGKALYEGLVDLKQALEVSEFYAR
jgi:phosphoribosylformimino-5-aminoimidazole carboxamide ribotide isomerase